MGLTQTASKRSSGNKLPTCKWCSKSFKSETTLSTHLCVKKKRWADKDLSHVRLGFMVFNKFYTLTTQAAKPKTIDDFIQSSYYEAFVKFGRCCMINEYMHPEKYAEWLINKGKKLDHWHKDTFYNEYLLEYIKREPGISALERTVMYLKEWSDESGIEWNQYFASVSPSRAVYDIRSGKVSPWVLYLSASGDKLLTRFNDEQVKLVADIIGANFWLPVFKKCPEEVQEIQMICAAANL